MNKHILYIVSSVFCLLLPIGAYLYGLWDSYQPKVGPVGNGAPIFPTRLQLVSLISTFLAGALNLPLALIRYVKYRERKKTGG